MLMTATEKLSQVLQGGYNLEFEIVEVIKDSKTIAKIEETIYIRQRSFGWIYDSAKLQLCHRRHPKMWGNEKFQPWAL